MGNDIYEIYGEQNRQKIDYFLKVFRKDFLIDAADEFVEKLNEMNLDEFVQITKEFPDNLKLVVENQVRTIIDNLRIENTEFRGPLHYTKLMCIVEKHIDSNTAIDKAINTNNIYKTFIESNVITYEELKNIIEDKIDVDRIDLYSIECNIYEEIKKRLPKKEELLKNLQSENDLKTKRIFEIFYDTNEVYKNMDLVNFLAESNIENINFANLDDIIVEPRLTEELIYNSSISEKLIECVNTKQPYDFQSIGHVINTLKAKPNTNDRRPTRDFSCIRTFEIYEKYGTYIRDMNWLSENITDSLTKETFDKVLGDNIDTIDLRRLSIEAIFCDMNLTEEVKLKMTSYLSNQLGLKLKINNLSIEDINVLRENVDVLSNENSNILKFYYIKNIQNDPELKEEVELLSSDLRSSVLNVNRYATKPELNNLLRALKEKKKESEESIDLKPNTIKEAVISKLPIEKRRELVDITKEMSFKEFNFDLDLPQHMTFGVELEFENLSYTTLKAMLKENILTDEIISNLGFDSKKKNLIQGWDVKRDGSVETGSEVVSPILKDVPRDWDSLKTICDIISFLGGQNNESCGGHIHIGSNILGTDSKAWENFLKIWENAEECIYKISNKEGDQIRKKVGQFASPTKNIIREILRKGSIHIENDDDIRNLANEYSSLTNSELTNLERYKGVNLYPIASNKQNTIEFRIPNGEINPVEIQKNIKLYAKILEVSKKMSVDPQYKNDLFTSLLSEKSTDEERLYSFIDLIFDESRDKAIYLSRYFNYPKELKIGEISYKEAIKKEPTKIERGGR